MDKITNHPVFVKSNITQDFHYQSRRNQQNRLYMFKAQWILDNMDRDTSMICSMKHYAYTILTELGRFEDTELIEDYTNLLLDLIEKHVEQGKLWTRREYAALLRRCRSGI